MRHLFSHFVIKSLVVIFFVSLFYVSTPHSAIFNTNSNIALAHHCRGTQVLVGNPHPRGHECKTQEQIAADSEDDGYFASLFAPITNAINWITSGAFLIQLTTLLLIMAGRIFDGSIYYFILTSTRLIDGGIGTSIVVGWTVLRDIINLTFVFGLIYIAFMTVIRANTHDLKHAVPKILIFAILINFSLFFTKIIIDVSNITSLEIYRVMAVQEPTSGGSQPNPDEIGIAKYFVTNMGLQSYFDAEKVQKSQKTVGTPYGFGGSVLISIIIVVAAFVLLAGALLIAIRFIVLVLLLVLSPVAFASGFIPKLNTEEWAHSWWKNMISQAIFAPAYLFMIWLSMKMVNVDLLSGNGGDLVTSMNPGTGSIGAIMNMMMVMGFLIGSLIIAQKAGAYGASTTMTWGKSMTRNTGSVLGRTFIGKPSGKLSEKYEKFAARRPDTRLVRAMDRLGMKKGLEAGKNAKFGGTHSVASKKHDKEARAKERGDEQAKRQRLTAVLNYEDNPNPTTKLELERSLKNASVKEIEDLGHDEILKNPDLIGSLTHSQIEGLMKSDHLSSTDKAKIGKIRQSQTEQRLSVDTDGNPQTLSKGIPTANTSQLKAIGVEKLLTKDPSTGNVYAASLSSGQMEDLKKELTETEFGMLKKARTDSIIDQFGFDPVTNSITGSNAKGFFAGKQEKEIAKLPKDILKHKESTQYLTKETLKKVLDNGDLTTDDRDVIRQNLEDMISTTAGPLLPGKKHPMQDFLDSPIGSRF